MAVASSSTATRVGFLLFLVMTAQATLLAKDLPPRAQNGVLDASQWQFGSQGTLRLKGEWEFFPDRIDLPAPAEKGEVIVLPAPWNTFKDRQGKARNCCGYAAFRLRIRLPVDLNEEKLTAFFPPVNTAAEYYVNGAKVGKQGVVAASAAQSKPDLRSTTITFDRGKSSEVEIVMVISNYFHRQGGARADIELSLPTQQRAHERWAFFSDAFLFGAILMTALFQFGMFVNRREDKGPLYFALFCLVMCLRTITTGEFLLFEAFPGIPYAWQKRLEIFGTYLAPGLFVSFIASIFPMRLHRYAVAAIWIAGITFFAHSIFFSSMALSHAISYFFIIMGIASLYSVATMLLAVKYRMAGAKSTLAGGMIFIVTVANDIAHNRGWINTAYVAHGGLFIFILAQSYVLTRLVGLTYRMIEVMSEAYSKFVPTEFLSQLQKKNITEIKLGDQVQKKMSILFSDIRNFTALSETLTPAQNFDFLNSYLKRMAPIVRMHHGFIDKFIGDAVMALFPGKADDALHCAIAMQKEILRYNEHRSGQGYAPIEIGIGIHEGDLMLGTIGAEERMDGTVISDAVNLSSRIEHVTKSFGARILISGHFFSALENPHNFHVRLLGRVAVRGKTESIEIYEVLDYLPENVLTRLAAVKPEFEEAVRLLSARRPEEAGALFSRILQSVGEDRVTQKLLDKCKATT